MRRRVPPWLAAIRSRPTTHRATRQGLRRIGLDGSSTPLLTCRRNLVKYQFQGTVPSLSGSAFPLTFCQCRRKMRPVRANSATALLIVWLLVGSGICLCAGSVPDAATSHAPDCSTEPLAPSDNTDEPCVSGCAAEDATLARTEAQVAGEFTYTIDPTLSETLTEPTGESARQQFVLSSEPPLPLSPRYIVLSVLLV